MGFAEQRLVMDLLAWAGNVSSSVLIIFVNKVLMNTTGYGFQYGEPLAVPLYISRCTISGLCIFAFLYVVACLYHCVVL